jgi:glutaredoxin-like protein NrdH
MPTITVYTKPSCQACRLTYKQLDKVGVDYTVVDISQDPEALEYVQSLGYKAAPVVVAGEAHWEGFRPERIKALAAGA